MFWERGNFPQPNETLHWSEYVWTNFDYSWMNLNMMRNADTLSVQLEKVVSPDGPIIYDAYFLGLPSPWMYIRASFNPPPLLTH